MAHVAAGKVVGGGTVSGMRVAVNESVITAFLQYNESAACFNSSLRLDRRSVTPRLRL